MKKTLLLLAFMVVAVMAQNPGRPLTAGNGISLSLSNNTYHVALDTGFTNNWTVLQTFSGGIDVIGNATFAGTVGGVGITNLGNLFTVKTRNISTTAPLSGGGTLAGDLTLSLPAATGSVDGYLSHTDWTTFNNKGSVNSIDVGGTVYTNTVTILGGSNTTIRAVGTTNYIDVVNMETPYSFSVSYTNFNANSMTNSYSLMTLSPSNYISKVSMRASGVVWTNGQGSIAFYIGNSANTEKYSRVLTVTNTAAGYITPYQFDSIFSVPGQYATSTNLCLFAIGQTNINCITNGVITVKPHIGVQP